MNLITGATMVIAGIATLVSTTMRKTAEFVYPMALFFCELGLVFIAGEVVPSEQAAVAVQVMLIIGMIPTTVLWMKRAGDYHRGLRK